MYLDKPKIVYPETKWGKRSKRPKIIAEQRFEVRDCSTTLTWNGRRSHCEPTKQGCFALSLPAVVFGQYKVQHVVKNGFSYGKMLSG